MKILVVDDDAMIRKMVDRILTRKGHHVALAGDGKEAMRMLSDDHYHLVISDVLMPDMDGVALVHALRRSGNDVPVLLMSGNCGSRATDVEALVANDTVKGLIVKPFSNADFLAAVEN